jgi:pimeloyl-[acyl-carrier protein] methyl ester esterase
MSSLPVCLLLPGFDGSGRLFEPLLAENDLPFEPRVLSLPDDRPRGYEDLAAWLERQVPRHPVVLLAESFSGPLAIRFASRHPNRVSRLILAATFLRSPLARCLEPFSVVARPLLFSRPPPALAVRALLAGWDAPPALLGAVRAVMATLPAEVAAARARAALACDESTAFAKTAAPTLWLQAGEDRLLRAGHGGDARVMRPGTQIETITAPHMMLQRRPQQCLARISSFLAT